MRGIRICVSGVGAGRIRVGVRGIGVRVSRVGMSRIRVRRIGVGGVAVLRVCRFGRRSSSRRFRSRSRRFLILGRNKQRNHHRNEQHQKPLAHGFAFLTQIH